MSTMQARGDRYYIFTGQHRMRVPQAHTLTDALLDAFARANGALNVTVETGPAAKPTSVDIVRRYDGTQAKLVTVTDAAGNVWRARPGDLIAA